MANFLWISYSDIFHEVHVRKFQYLHVLDIFSEVVIRLNSIAILGSNQRDTLLQSEK